MIVVGSAVRVTHENGTFVTTGACIDQTRIKEMRQRANDAQRRRLPPAINLACRRPASGRRLPSTTSPGLFTVSNAGTVSDAERDLDDPAATAHRGPVRERALAAPA